MASSTRTNIIACEVVATTMKHLLGPKSMDMLIDNGDGDVIVTNDGVTALENMQIEHPAAKLLVQLSKAMDDAHGDGTTSVVILAGELGVHPTKIIRHFMDAATRAAEIISDMEFSFIPTTEDGKRILVETAKTALHSKLVSHAAPRLALLAVEALLHAHKADSERMTVTRYNADLHVVLVNGLYDQSCVLPGIILESGLVGDKGSLDAHARQLNFALLQFPLTKPRQTQNVKVILSTASDVDKLLREEESYIKSLVVAIKKLGIEAIGLEDQVLDETLPDVAKSLLAKLKIKILPVLSKKMFMKLSRSLNCTPITSHAMLSDIQSKKHLVKASIHVPIMNSRKPPLIEPEIYEVSIGSETRACIEAVSVETSGDSTTIGTIGSVILCGGSEMYLTEVERAFHDAACVVSTLIHNPKIVPGAGVCESKISAQMEKEAETLGDVSGMIWKAFSSAMEIIPLTLARNSGMDPLNTMATLKAKHSSPEGKMFGVDVFDGCVSDMSQKEIWEPVVNKQAQCIMATEVATAILKIDSIHSVKDIMAQHRI